ncbi:glycosyltransferase [Candidatus Sumerlaeota bacterium]|nr:glycosyltransferase [Candidatus Sumerlaeota bacterium]
MAKPRVVHVYKDFWPPVVGGIERAINWMIGGLRERFDFTVLVNSRTRQTREREWEGVRVIEVGEWGRVQSAPVSPAFPLWLRKLQADIWHFHIPNPTGDLSWWLARPRGKVVCTYHSDIVRQKGALRFYRPFLRSFLRHCDAIMPTSPRLIDASPLLTEFREKCRPVPLGMPMKPFEKTMEMATRAKEIKKHYRGLPLIIFVGKLRYYKGLQFMVSAMRAFPQTRFLIIGEGPEGPKLQRLVAEFQLGDRIVFLGELPDEEVIAHLHAGDMFVLPSHLPSEAFGLSQVEAMACGLPVISCDLPTGVPYVNQNEVTGFTIFPGSDVTLANAISEMLSHAKARFAMGEAALRRAHAEFSQEAMCERVGNVYSEVLK